MLPSDAAQWAATASVVAAIASIATAGVALKALLIARGQLGAYLSQSRSDAEAAERHLNALQAQIEINASAVEQAKSAAAEQLAELERQRKLQVRPVVYPVSARLFAARDRGASIIVKLANVGMGPVLRVDLEAWAFPVAEGLELGEYVASVLGRAAEIQDMAPTGVATLQYPGRPGYSCEVLLRPNQMDRMLTFPVHPSYDVLVRLRYRDIHGETYTFPDEQLEGAVYPFPLLAHLDGGNIESQWKPN